ncbi:MAG: hypothetical protein P8O16_04755 [Algoriphagus sp.]|uniref:hypothetical protein n=1 Tax=Algoriphagus sp. TaxID=1872435 RepID=UPI00260F60A6|nr:hypothetical protein [Algoriphagus sp.]MDG1276568.1 hypothetical protein [Algoriphagus sp.]
MTTNYYKLLEIEEKYDIKIRENIYIVKLTPAYIDEVLDGFTYSFQNAKDFIFLKNDKIFNFFHSNPDELKSLNLEDFQLIEKNEVYNESDKEIFEHKDYVKKKKDIIVKNIVTSLEINERKENKISKEVSHEIKLKFIKKEDELFALRPENAKDFYNISEDLNTAIMAFLEDLIFPDSYSAFKNTDFSNFENGNFETILTLINSDGYLTVKKPKILENNGFTKNQIFISTKYFMKNYFHLNIKDDICNLFVSELDNLEISYPSKFQKGTLDFNIFKEKNQIFANKPKSKIKLASFKGREALSLSIESFLNQLTQNSFDVNQFESHGLSNILDQKFEVKLSFSYNQSEVIIDPPNIIKCIGLTKLEILDTILGLSDKYVSIEFSKNTINQWVKNLDSNY